MATAEFLTDDDEVDLGRWTPEQGRAYEVAEWILGGLIGECSAATAAERGKVSPDQGQLTVLADRVDHYTAVRRSLNIHDPEQLHKIIAEYGTIARTGAANAPRRQS